MFDAMKDEAIRMGLNMILGGRGYGSVRELEFHKDEKTVRLVLELKGEPESIEVKVERYEIFEKGEKTYATCEEVTVSREWMHRLAQDQVKGSEIEIPKELAGVAKSLL